MSELISDFIRSSLYILLAFFVLWLTSQFMIAFDRWEARRDAQARAAQESESGDE